MNDQNKVHDEEEAELTEEELQLLNLDEETQKQLKTFDEDPNIGIKELDFDKIIDQVLVPTVNPDTDEFLLVQAELLGGDIDEIEKFDLRINQEIQNGNLLGSEIAIVQGWFNKVKGEM